MKRSCFGFAGTSCGGVGPGRGCTSGWGSGRTRGSSDSVSGNGCGNGCSGSTSGVCPSCVGVESFLDPPPPHHDPSMPPNIAPAPAPKDAPKPALPRNIPASNPKPPPTRPPARLPKPAPPQPPPQPPELAALFLVALLPASTGGAKLAAHEVASSLARGGAPEGCRRSAAEGSSSEAFMSA